MNLNDWLNVELYSNNLKMFNQACEETSCALGNASDEHVLENLCERQVKTSTLIRNAMSFFIKNVLKTRAEKLPEIKDSGKFKHRAATAEHVDFSEESAQETEQQHTLRKELKRKAKIDAPGHQKAHTLKA